MPEIFSALAGSPWGLASPHPQEFPG